MSDQDDGNIWIRSQWDCRNEITASVTHELNNVLGIIEQVAGLIEDLVDTDPDLSSEVVDELEAIANKIVAQTERGTALMKKLNRFVHLGDDPVTEFNLGSILDVLVPLMQRSAALRGTELHRKPDLDYARLRTSPEQVAAYVFRCLRTAIACAMNETVITIEPTKVDNGAGLRILVPSASEADRSGPIPMLHLSGDMKASSSAKGENGALTIEVMFSFG